MMNWLEKLMLLTLIENILKKRLKMLIKKKADTSKCFLTQDFNRLTKINFNTRIKEALKKKILRSQSE